MRIFHESKKRTIPSRILLIQILVLLILMSDYNITNAAINKVWVNDGGDKVTRDEMRSTNGVDVRNRLWNGTEISLFGAKNEVISFNLILEAAAGGAQNVSVVFNQLVGPRGIRITSTPAQGNRLFSYVGRNIELFFVRYLQINGLSLLTWDGLYDERHVPKRFQRPWVGEGNASGTWFVRPDHNKFYPDIAVPLELETPFNIPANNNQSVWADIYIPKNIPAGKYVGTVVIKEDSGQTRNIPVSLMVYNFTLPDFPSALTMLYYSQENINYRFFRDTYIDWDTPDYKRSLEITDRYFQMAHRHKVSLISNYTFIDEMEHAWVNRLNGSLFTKAKGYDGPGVGVGNNVYSVGTYSSWTWVWNENSKQQMWSNTDTWVTWFTNKNFSTRTDYFLYLIDESSDYEAIERWAQWIDSNPGPGKKMLSMATTSEPSVWATQLPSLDIPTSGLQVGITKLWEDATRALLKDPGKRFYYYNGARPASGSFATEDDGVSLRLNGWIQHKKKIDRWFYWESTYYDNYQGEMGQTNVFNRAHTYGGPIESGSDPYARGETGWNYTNGDGVLFYPGRDRHFTHESYNIDGPIASLRLKHWRRGIQDADYLALAQAVNPTATQALVNKMIPKVLWEYGVENEEDPSFKYTDISWSIDPDDWENARAQLAHIISSQSPSGIGLPWILLLIDK